MKTLWCFVALALVVAAAPAASGWGFATHTLVADDLHKQDGAKEHDTIYGASAPDLFNLVTVVDPYAPDGLYALTHDDVERLWAEARTGREKALAFGFCSHSDVWGADSTAHHDGITFGEGEGYVIAKVQVMRTLLEYAGADLPTVLPDVPEELADEIYHEILEYGMDLLATRIDPMVGYKMMEAAEHRSDRFVTLLWDAYGEDLSEILGEDARAMLEDIEAWHREHFYQYGMLLTLDDESMFAGMTALIAELAEGYLGIYGIELPDGFDPSPLIEIYLGLAMDLCADDYEDEVLATKELVEEQLADRGIYGSMDFLRAKR